MQSKLKKQLWSLVGALLLALGSQSVMAATLTLEDLAAGTAGASNNITVQAGSIFSLYVNVNNLQTGVSGTGVNIDIANPGLLTLDPASLVYNTPLFQTGNVINPPGNTMVKDPANQFLHNIDGTGNGVIVGTSNLLALDFTAGANAGTTSINLSAFVPDFANNIIFGWSTDGVTPINFASVTGATVTITPAAVPLPPAVLLFGSSLLGLLGVNGRRKA